MSRGTDSDGIHAPPHPDKRPQCMQWQPAQMKLNVNQKEKSSSTTQTRGKMKPMWKHICKKYGKLTTLLINKFSCDE